MSLCSRVLDARDGEAALAAAGAPGLLGGCVRARGFCLLVVSMLSRVAKSVAPAGQPIPDDILREIDARARDATLRVCTLCKREVLSSRSTLFARKGECVHWERRGAYLINTKTCEMRAALPGGRAGASCLHLRDTPQAVTFTPHLLEAGGALFRNEAPTLHMRRAYVVLSERAWCIGCRAICRQATKCLAARRALVGRGGRL